MKCKPDLTCSQAFARATDLQMSGTMWYKLKCVAKYPTELQTSCIMTSFGFSWKMKNLCQKPSMTAVLILTSFLQAVRHLAKKIEASKATACHIKQGASDPQAVQINLMRHQCTDLSSSKHKKSFQVKTTQSQAVYKWAKTSATIQEEVWSQTSSYK